MTTGGGNKGNVVVMWKVNAGRRSKFAADFSDLSIVAIGWREIGDPTRFARKADLLAAIAEAYPDHSSRQAEVSANQIWRFLKEVKEGDDVITYDPLDRVYLIGRIMGAPDYKPDIIEELPTCRAVEWTGRASRDSLSDTARNALGAILTLFLVREEVARELEQVAATPVGEIVIARPQALDDETEAASDPFETIEEQALERIKDRLMGLGWDDMQEIVAALLRALGYRTIISPAGPDRGKDILASRDGFGFESPRIVVEVKHRKGAMGAPEIRAFLGGRHTDDRGLYVSTGGFTREAHFEAERASTVTHLMTLDGLARAIVDNYDKMDERGRKLLPLTRLYWPS